MKEFIKKRLLEGVSTNEEGDTNRAAGVLVKCGETNRVLLLLRAEGEHSKTRAMISGGVDEGEDYITAMRRELLEETGIKNIEIIKEIEKVYQYELPENLVGIIWKGKYRGQKQKWFITRFLGDEKEVNLNTKHAEFIDWKWIEPKFLPEVIVNFKKDLYINLLKEINHVIG